MSHYKTIRAGKLEIIFKMTKNRNSGTLSTRKSSDKKVSVKPPKEKQVISKAKALLGKVRYHPHANERMGQPNIVIYEVLQALWAGIHVPEQDRYSVEHESWQYSIEGITKDKRLLRIGVSFEVDPSTKERLLVITVIEPGK